MQELRTYLGSNLYFVHYPDPQRFERIVNGEMVDQITLADFFALRTQLAQLESTQQAEAAAFAAAGLAEADYGSTAEGIGLLAKRVAGLETAINKVRQLAGEDAALHLTADEIEDILQPALAEDGDALAAHDRATRIDAQIDCARNLAQILKWSPEQIEFTEQQVGVLANFRETWEEFKRALAERDEQRFNETYLLTAQAFLDALHVQMPATGESLNSAIERGLAARDREKDMRHLETLEELGVFKRYATEKDAEIARLRERVAFMQKALLRFYPYIESVNHVHVKPTEGDPYIFFATEVWDALYAEVLPPILCDSDAEGAFKVYRAAKLRGAK